FQRPGEVIDRVVLHGPRAVAPGIGDLEPEILRGFLSGLDLERDAVALRIELTVRTFVDRKGGIDQFALVPGEPLRSVERAAGLLAAGESELECPSRSLVRLLH